MLRRSRPFMPSLVPLQSRRCQATTIARAAAPVHQTSLLMALVSSGRKHDIGNSDS